MSPPSLTLRATQLPAQGAGVDFALLVFPEGFESGTLVFMTDLGVVGAARLPAVTLLARRGASVLAAASVGGGGLLNGYLGAGAIVCIAPSIGLRFDVERRFGAGVDPRNGFFVIGMAIISFPRGRQPDG